MARSGAVGIDFSPVVALLVLFIAIQILVRLQRFGQRLAASELPPGRGPRRKRVDLSATRSRRPELCQGPAVSRSTAASSSSVSVQADVAATLARTCAGEVAPAMTDATCA